MKTNRIHFTIAAIAIMVQLFFGFQSVLPGTTVDVVNDNGGRGVCNDISCG